MIFTQEFRRRYGQFTHVSPLNTLLLLGVLAIAPRSHAQQNGVVGQTERQIKIIQERSSLAQAQTAKANQALANNDFESAFALAKSAVDALPSGGAASAGLRSMAMEAFSKASLALAKQRISEGRYDDAELVVKTAVPLWAMYTLLAFKSGITHSEGTIIVRGI